MRKLASYLGILLIAISFTGTLFFRHYKGEIITYPFMWYIGFGILGLAGFLLIYRSGSIENATATEGYLEAIDELKKTSRKVDLDFDNCDFKSGSYTQQVEEPDMSTFKILLPHPLAIHMDTTKTVTQTQSFLVYTEAIAEEKQKFISRSFPVDRTTLEYYVLSRKLSLYVDRFDKRRYYFELIN